MFHWVFHIYCSAMYWADAGYNERIETADLDGNNRHVLVHEGLSHPTGLAVDANG